MKELLATLMLHSHNIHILHWKTSGPGFQPNHEYLDEVYGEILKHIDLVAEIMLQRGENPISYSDMLDLTSHRIVVDPTYHYDESSTFKRVLDIFVEISTEIDKLYEITNLDRVHAAEFETIQSWYKLRYLYLIPQRIKGIATTATESNNILNILKMID